MFRKSAAYYDAIYRGLKDYADEAMKLNYLLEQLNPRPSHLLDIGCGTGEHARHLARNFGYRVDGIDIEPDFIQIAAEKLPESDFSVGDMRDFALPDRYDAALCLFSSIGYVETIGGLYAACASIAHHLKPRGWLICEPWLTPDQWKPGQVDALEAVDPASGASITRTRIGHSDGAVSVLQVEYDVRAPDETFALEETHRLGLFSREQTTAALVAAGFAVKWLEHGLRGGSLFIAQYQP